MPEVTPTAPAQADADARQNDSGSGPSRLWRVGCGILLPLWFMLLLMPCALLFLAVNGEIRIWHNSVPEPHSQPRLLISLISDRDNRGLRIESSSIYNTDFYTEADALSTCVETKVRFLLWESRGGGQDVSYCECYERVDKESAWAWQRAYGNSCAAAE